MPWTCRFVTPRDGHQPISACFSALGWDKPPELYERYLEEQRGDRPVFFAFAGGELAG